MKSNDYCPNILDKVNAKYAKLPVSWYEPGNGLYKTANVVYYIFFAFTVIYNFILASGYNYQVSRLSQSENTSYECSLYKNAYTSFTIGTVIIIAGLVIKLFMKKFENSEKEKIVNLIFFIVTAVGSVFLIVTSVNVLLTRAVDGAYAAPVEGSTAWVIYLRLFACHIIPLLVLILCSFFIWFSKMKRQSEIDRMYKNMVDRIYKDFVKDNPTYSEAQWQEYLENYGK